MNNTYLKRLLTALLLLTAYLTNGLAQEVGDFTFTHIGKADGMHSQRVYTILQTRDGAVWWSTKNGVERYNGVSIRYYPLRSGNTVGDLAGRFIKLGINQNETGLLPDAANLQAFDNMGRIYNYDAVNDQFCQTADIGAITHRHTEPNDILETGEGLWLATNEGIFFLDGGQLTHVVKDVHANCIIQTGTALLFCTRTGVLEYSKSRKGKPQAGMRMRTIVPYDVESGYYDPLFNKVWLGGYASGIRVLSHNEAGHIEGCELIQTATEIHNPIRSICPFNDHTMLVGIDGLGVYQVSRHPTPTGYYEGRLLFDANQGPHGMLYGNGIYAIARDLWGNIFIGSYSGGIDMARPVGTTLAVFRHRNDDLQSILNDHVNCVAELDDGTLVIGTDNGISMLNPQNGQWRHACRGCVVINVCQTADGKLLAATYGRGVLEVGRDGQSRQRFSKAGGVLKDDHVYKLFYDRSGDLWIGCLDGELVQVKAGGGVVYHPIRYVKEILQLADGRMVVGTSYGLKTISARGQVSDVDYGGGKEDVNKHIHSLYLHGEDLWIGTDGGGIYIYNLKSKGCRQLTTHEGLTSDYVNSLCKDGQGRIMAATEGGLSYIDAKAPERAVGVNYCYGVDREYTSRAVTVLHNGNILFGSTTGALIIDPQHVQEINYVARMNITGVTCHGETSRHFNADVHQMLQKGELQLSYGQRTFDLLFESINLRNQSDIVYQYQVGNGSWSLPTDEQHIRFTNLEAGKHLLKVRCVSRTCGAVLDEARLTIRIGQPWWNSWWMWTVYLLLLVAAFYGALRIYQLHAKYMRLVMMNVEDSEAANSEVTETATDAPTPPATDEESTAFIDKVTRLVVDNLADTEFNIDRLCREMAMSRTLFYIKLKSYTGKSPQDFIRIIRLERAASLLRSGRQVTDVAIMTGFDNPKYFSTVFKKYFGVSPSKY